MKRTVKQQRPVVSEVDLLDILTQRAHLQALRKKERDTQAQLEQKEAQVIALLKSGACVEGHRTAAIECRTGPCRPKYQELWVIHMGEAHGVTEALALETAKTKYPGKPTEVLVIGEAYPGILDGLQGQA